MRLFRWHHVAGDHQHMLWAHSRWRDGHVCAAGYGGRFGRGLWTGPGGRYYPERGRQSPEGNARRMSVPVNIGLIAPLAEEPPRRQNTTGSFANLEQKLPHDHFRSCGSRFPLWQFSIKAGGPRL